MKASEILEQALALLGPQGENWIQRLPAVDAQGLCTQSDAPEACKWCMLGAIWRIERLNKVEYIWSQRAGATAEGCLSAAGIRTPANFNDESTFPEVKAAFEAGIAKARNFESAGRF